MRVRRERFCAQGPWELKPRSPNAAKNSDSLALRAARATLPCGRSHSCDLEKTGLASRLESHGEAGGKGIEERSAARKWCVFCLSPNASARRNRSLSGGRASGPDDLGMRANRCVFLCFRPGQLSCPLRRSPFCQPALVHSCPVHAHQAIP